MTKEELAKRKGLKPKDKSQTAAEALITVRTENTETTIKKEIEAKTDIPKIKNEASKKSTSSNDKEKSSKVGRPKGKPSTKISLNVPNEFLELMEIAAGLNFKGNTSSYIVSLIENDIKENKRFYEKIKNLKNS